MIRLQQWESGPYIFPICAASLTCVKSAKSVLALAGFKLNRCFAFERLSPTGSWSRNSKAKRIGVRKPFKFAGLERRDGLSLIEPDVFIKLLRQHGLEIMTL